MGGGRGGKGRSGKGKGNGKAAGSAKNWQGDEDEEEWGDEWNDPSWQAGSWQDTETHSPSGRDRRQGAVNSFALNQSSSFGAWQDNALARPLAAQTRFACRILQRHAPEERVHDPRRDIRLGDHVFIRESWDFVERHAIVCSSNSEEAGRRSSREDPHWVVQWVQDSSRLECTALSQFCKGGELFRVSYPHWVCQCYVPTSTTMKPQFSEEYNLEAERPEAVARRANASFEAGQRGRNGSWSPSWSQAPDLEFCIQTKTGANAPIEIHSRKTLTSSIQWPLACPIGGECKPSLLFGVGKAGGAGSGGANSPTSNRSPPGFASQWANSASAPTPPANRVPEWSLAQAVPAQAFGGAWEGDPNWQGWQAPAIGAPMVAPSFNNNPMSGISASLAASHHAFSVDAQEFVPGGPQTSMPPWNASQALSYQ